MGDWIFALPNRRVQRSRRPPNVRWGLQTDEVLEVVRHGEMIAEYADDKPFPSWLFLGFPSGGPLHVVAALDSGAGTCHVITAYPPDPARWREDFKTRRTP